MALKADEVYGALMSEIAKVASGFDHAVRTGDNTFSIFFIDGSKVDLTIPLPKDGEDGLGIDNVEIDADKHLIVTFTDGTTHDAGLLTTQTALEEDLTATVEIGSVTNGKKYLKGTSLEKIIRDILIKEVAPSVTLTLAPSDALYDITGDGVDSIKLTAKVTKGTYEPKKIEFYVGTTKVFEENITSGATSFSYDYVPATPIKENTTFKAVVTDSKATPMSGQTTKTIKFVGQSYYGLVASDTGAPTDVQIKALNKTLKDVKGYVYKNIICDFNKVVYAYPSEFEALTSIKDIENNINYTNSFTRTTVKVDGIDYYCYTLTEPTGADGVDITFA